MKQIRNENEKQKIADLYNEGKLTHKQIGKIYNMSENGICSLLRRMGIKGIKKYENISGEKNCRWKGGIMYKEGRKMIRINKKYIYEYVYIMEQYIGRKLRRGEVVHHINGNINDNKIENLQLMTISEHMKLHAKQGDLIMMKNKGKSKYGFIYDNCEEYDRLYNKIHNKIYYQNNKEKILQKCKIKYQEIKNVS